MRFAPLCDALHLPLPSPQVTARARASGARRSTSRRRPCRRWARGPPTCGRPRQACPHRRATRPRPLTSSRGLCPTQLSARHPSLPSSHMRPRVRGLADSRCARCLSVMFNFPPASLPLLYAQEAAPLGLRQLRESGFTATVCLPAPSTRRGAPQQVKLVLNPPHLAVAQPRTPTPTSVLCLHVRQQASDPSVIHDMLPCYHMNHGAHRTGSQGA